MKNAVEDTCAIENANAGLSFVVLMPAYEPDKVLVELVDEVIGIGQATYGFEGVVVVNDGSKKDEARAVFEALGSRPFVRLITHVENRGKGGALKTGFGAVYKDLSQVDFIITADADGQHTAADIFRLALQAQASGRPNIGYRSFSKGVPLRSRIGNILTAALFRMATGKDIKDTQSGLRTYRRGDLPMLCNVAADRYDFEFHCLFQLAQTPGLHFDQVPIETIYEPGNPTSHFNPLLDSVRIYAVFLRYVSVSILSGALDFVLFSLFVGFGAATLVSLVCARVITAPIYLLGMRNFAFKSRGNIVKQSIGTLFLMTLHVIFLWRFIGWMETSLGVNRMVAMLTGLLTFYFGVFLIQRIVIYPNRLER